jgi:hypothetical protein
MAVALAVVVLPAIGKEMGSKEMGSKEVKE